MTHASSDPVARLRPMNPVPDPDAVVDPVAREGTLRRVLDAPPGRAWRPARRTLARRAVVIATLVLVMSGGLLMAGERGSAPSSAGVLPALARELTQSRGILQVRERTVTLDESGRRVGELHAEEEWTLLDDPFVSRFRIGIGERAEQGALDRDGTSDYDPESNT